MNLSATLPPLHAANFNFQEFLKTKTSSISWMDLPQADFREILQVNCAEVDNLNFFVEQYHRIPKDSKDHLTKRIELLCSIVDLLNSCISSAKKTDFSDLLQRLRDLSSKKLRHLESLLIISKLGPECIPLLEKYHCDTSQYQNRQFIPFTMKNDSSYSVKMKEFWGNFWLETLDPCHRRISPYYNHWIQTNGNVDPINFLLWLEAQCLPKNISTVPYLNEKEAETYRAKVVDGQLFLLSGNDSVLPLSTGNERYIYVIDLNLDLFIAKGSLGLWHSSFTFGGPVLGVGVLRCSMGVISMISFESGHYRPTMEQGYQSLQILLEKGLNVTNPLTIQFYENRCKYQVEVLKSEILSPEKIKAAITDDLRKEVISFNEF